MEAEIYVLGRLQGSDPGVQGCRGRRIRQKKANLELNLDTEKNREYNKNINMGFFKNMGYVQEHRTIKEDEKLYTLKNAKSKKKNNME